MLYFKYKLAIQNISKNQNIDHFPNVPKCGPLYFKVKI